MTEEQIQDLIDERDALSEDCAKAEERIDELEKEVRELNDKLSAIKGHLADAEEAISGAQKYI